MSGIPQLPTHNRPPAENTELSHDPTVTIQPVNLQNQTKYLPLNRGIAALLCSAFEQTDNGNLKTTWMMKYQSDVITMKWSDMKIETPLRE